ncbi:hypothetical protein CR969_02550 [Candidatus Saccharibacteria bacterium]|nr:MAG: hypothetical protein CR969_02550 [Candidatus Saccharibacteria bacterium]
MLEFIALLAPSIMATGFYNHLSQDKLPTRKLIFAFGTFLILINLCVYMIGFYIININELHLYDKSFINYTVAATVFALIMPLVLRMIEASIQINVSKNDD